MYTCNREVGPIRDEGGYVAATESSGCVCVWVRECICPGKESVCMCVCILKRRAYVFWK